MRSVAAIDLGAENGRVLTVTLRGGHLAITERYRFASPTYRDGAERLRWDLAALSTEVRAGLAAVGAADRVSSVGVDTWGIDFGLLDGQGRVLDDPVSHRDERIPSMLAEAVEAVGRERLHAATGSHLLPCNAIYQLLALARDRDPALAAAESLLMVPDLLHYKLSGVPACEYTDATTTGCFDVVRGRWATELLDDLDLPHGLLGDVVSPGTQLGPLRDGLAEAEGRRGARPYCGDACLP